MDSDPVRYAEVLHTARISTESLTIVLVSGGSRSAVLELLGADAVGGAAAFDPDVNFSAYAVTEVVNGIMAIEHTGYADPSPRVLAALSTLGGAAAVSRHNIQQMERFGCASEGTSVFDANEFMYVDRSEKSAVPAGLRELFDSAWVDLDVGDDNPAAGLVSLAMAARHTSLDPTAADLARATSQGYHRTKSFTYYD